MSTVVLITGASRGLGKGLLERYLNLPNHTIIAANRNPSHQTSTDLQNLPKAPGTKLIIVKIDATIWQDAFDAVRSLETDHGIDHLDVVVANAGVSYIWPTVADVKEEDIVGHFAPNVLGYVALYQATRGLLKKSKREPVLANMGSTAGSLS
jgi:norsolorinic acid ketoreductase